MLVARYGPPSTVLLSGTKTTYSQLLARLVSETWFTVNLDSAPQPLVIANLGNSQFLSSMRIQEHAGKIIVSVESDVLVITSSRKSLVGLIDSLEFVINEMHPTEKHPYDHLHFEAYGSEEDGEYVHPFIDVRSDAVVIERFFDSEDEKTTTILTDLV